MSDKRTSCFPGIERTYRVDAVGARLVRVVGLRHTDHFVVVGLQREVRLVVGARLLDKLGVVWCVGANRRNAFLGRLLGLVALRRQDSAVLW